MDPSQGDNLVGQSAPSSVATGDGKRRRRPTTFAGFLTSDRQFDNLITGRQATPERLPGEGAAEATEDLEDHDQAGMTLATTATVSTGPEAAAASAAAAQQQPQAAPQPLVIKRRKTNVPIKGEAGTTTQSGRQAGSASYPVVKKVVGVQNATRKALEWLQYGDLSLLDLAQSLPKLSKARVEIVMEALRAAGLVTLVRKHAPDSLVRGFAENWE